MDESATTFALNVQQVALLGINKLVVFAKSNQLNHCKEGRHQAYIQGLWTVLKDRGYAAQNAISNLTHKAGGRNILDFLVVIDDKKYKLSVNEIVYKDGWQIVGLYNLLELVKNLEFQYQLFKWARLPGKYALQMPLEITDLIELIGKYSDDPSGEVFEPAKRQFLGLKEYQDLMEGKDSMDLLTVRGSASVYSPSCQSSALSASSKTLSCSDSDTSSEEAASEQVGRDCTPYSETSPSISFPSLSMDLSITGEATPIIPLSPRQPSRCSMSPFPLPDGNGDPVDEVEESSGFVASALPWNLASATPNSQQRRSHSDTSAPLSTGRKRSKRAGATRKSVLGISRNGKIKLVNGLDILVRRAVRLGKKVVYEGQVYNISKIAG